MKTPAECKRMVDNLITDRIMSGQPDLSSEDVMRIMESRWPKEEDQECFIKYLRGSVATLMSDLTGSTTNPVLPADFVKQVKDTNFNEDAEVIALLRIQTSTTRCWVPLGRDAETSIFYRLVPEAHGLLTTKDNQFHRDDILPLSFLGVNLDVVPKGTLVTENPNRRRKNVPEESTRTEETDDFNVNGFAFHQLGTLQYSVDENYKSHDDLANAMWYNSNFYAVGKTGCRWKNV